MDRPRPTRGARAPGRRMTVSRFLYLYGDDDLLAARMADRFAAALAAQDGAPLDRWEVRADQTNAGTVAAGLRERLATAGLFGGGTLAVVADPGALARRNDTRATVVEALALAAPGNAAVFIESAKANAKGPGPRRLADAVTAAGGRVTAVMAPRPTGLAAWIETEARDRGLRLAAGAARELAERLGARVTDGDVERRHVTRVAANELDKLTLRHALDQRPITPEDVRDLVAATTPASVWALTDAVGDRREEAALTALDRLLDATPEPVLLAVLHRRVVELLELGDRLANGAALPAAARAMGITSEFRAKTLAGQARRWRTEELA